MLIYKRGTLQFQTSRVHAGLQKGKISRDDVQRAQAQPRLSRARDSTNTWQGGQLPSPEGSSHQTVSGTSPESSSALPYP